MPITPIMLEEAAVGLPSNVEYKQVQMPTGSINDAANLAFMNDQGEEGWILTNRIGRDCTFMREKK